MAEIPLDDDDGSGSDSAAMMEAMGFTGFGMQRPTKKRKYDEQHHHDGAGFDAASGTGANTAPLGERRGIGPALPSRGSGLPARPGRKKTATGVGGSRDADEIDLDDGGGDDDDDNQQDAGGNGADVEDGGAEVSARGAGPQYIDTSRPSRGYLPEELEDMEMQAKIDAIMTAAVGGQSGYSNQHQYQQPQHQQHRQQQPPRHRPTHQQGGGGTPWWEGYYDAKMNENPWEKLERERGLQPRGAWVARGAAAGPGRADRAQAAAGGAAAAGSAPGEADEAVGGVKEKSAANDAEGSVPAG